MNDVQNWGLEMQPCARLTMAERLRTWQDRGRIIRKRLPRIKAAEVILVSYPKSGRTWLRVMMSHIYHLRYATPVTELIEFDNLRAINPKIPKILFEHVLHLPKYLSWQLVRSLPKKKLIFLVRDPRDVIVSYYFHYATRSKVRERLRLGLPRDVAGTPLADFALDPRYGLPGVIGFMNCWLKIASRAPQMLLLRYEDVQADPKTALRQLCDFLGEQASEAELEAAVAFTSFEQLQKMERQHFFGSERMHPRDDSDPNAFKVRRGKVGGYRDYLDDRQIAMMDDLVASRLCSRFGYARNPGSGEPALGPTRRRSSG